MLPLADRGLGPNPAHSNVVCDTAAFVDSSFGVDMAWSRLAYRGRWGFVVVGASVSMLVCGAACVQAAPIMRAWKITPGGDHQLSGSIRVAVDGSEPNRLSIIATNPGETNVLRVGGAGQTTVVAGTDKPCLHYHPCGEGTSAQATQLGHLGAPTVGPNGDIYFIEEGVEDDPNSDLDT